MCNLLFEMERKWVAGCGDDAAARLHRRMMQVIDEAGYRIHNPLNEIYDETRTDVEASILQDDSGHAHVMRIRTVLKPVIYRKTADESLSLVQRGVVIAG
jgi:hypothetical protein